MIDFSVRFDDREGYEVTADSRDVYVFEKTSKQGRTLNDLIDGKSFVDLYRLCHIASKRQGLTGLSEEEFAERAMIELGGDDEGDEEADPTRPAA